MSEFTSTAEVDDDLVEALKLSADGWKARAEEAEKERDRFRDALDKIDRIRNSIVGLQAINWSAHIYPLVAALGEAGFQGVGYEKARAEAITLLDARDAAIRQRAALLEVVRVASVEAEKLNTEILTLLRGDGEAGAGGMQPTRRKIARDDLHYRSMRLMKVLSEALKGL